MPETQASDCCCYILGVPIDVKGDKIIDELLKRDIEQPIEISVMGAYDGFGKEQKYIKLIFSNPKAIEQILSQSNF